MKDPIALIIAILSSGLGASCIFYPECIYRVVTPEQAARDRKRAKRCGFVLLPLGLFLLALYFFSDSVGPIQYQRARQVIRDCMAATDALEKSPPGFARADEFVRRIKAIDTRGTPDDLVAALHEHIDLLEQSLAAFREGKDHEQLDQQVAVAKERFATKVRKYW